MTCCRLLALPSAWPTAATARESYYPINPCQLEKIMSKTNDNSNTLEHRDTLADSKLDAVTGGDLSALPKLISGVQRLLDTTTTAIIRSIVHIP